MLIELYELLEGPFGLGPGGINLGYNEEAALNAIIDFKVPDSLIDEDVPSRQLLQQIYLLLYCLRRVFKHSTYLQQLLLANCQPNTPIPILHVIIPLLPIFNHCVLNPKYFPQQLVQLQPFEENLNKARNVVVADGHLQDVCILRPVDAIHCEHEVA